MSENTLENIIFGLKTELKELKAKYVKMLDLNEKAITKQNTEIERLNGCILKYAENLGNEQRKSAELQKQVNELKEELATAKQELINEQRYYENAYSKACQLETQNTELQKQIDELKAKNERLKSFIDFKTANIRCDNCKQQVIKDTAEKFAEMAKELLDKQEKGWSANMIWIITAKNCIDETCKKITE